MEQLKISIDVDSSKGEQKIKSFITAMNNITPAAQSNQSAFVKATQTTETYGRSVESAEKKVERYKAALDKTGDKANSYKSSIDKSKKSTTQYGEAAENAEKKTKGFGLGLTKLLAVAGMFISISAVKDFATSSIEAYKEANVIAQKLDANMQVVKGYGKDPIKIKIATENINDTATKIQAKGVYGDDEMIAGAAQLSTFQMTDQHITKLLPKMADMVANQKGLNGTADDFYNNANMIGKAISTGQLAALKKVGITIDENDMKTFENLNTTERVAMMEKILGENVGNVNEKLRSTPEGKIQALKNSFGDMQERIGAKLIPVLGDLAGWFEGKIPSLEAGINKVISGFEKTVEWVTKNKDLLINLGIVAGTMIAAFKGYQTIIMLTKTWQAVTKGMTLAQWAFNAAATANPVGLIIVGIAAVIGIGILLWKNWDKIKAKTQELWSKFLQSPLGTVVKAGFDKVIGAVKQAVTNFMNIKNKVQELWSKFSNSPLGTVTKAFFDLLNPLKSAEKLLSGVAGWWSKITSGKKTLEVETKETKGGAKVDGTHFSGLWKVPFDGYMAELHRNEMVLTSGEAEQYRGFVNNQSTSTPFENKSTGYFKQSSNTNKSNTTINMNTNQKNTSDTLLVTVLNKLLSKLDKFDKLELLERLKDLKLNNNTDFDAIVDQYYNLAK